jgi:predicted restriction endonuclease
MSKQKYYNGNRIIKDAISVQDIILEYVIDSGWKDYKKFVRKLTERIIKKQPSSPEELAKLIRNFSHPFYKFNCITKEQFLAYFPINELLGQSKIPRVPFLLKRKTLSAKLRYEVFKRDQFKCRICGRTAKETKLEVDHIIPVSKGGTDDLDNLQTLCVDCNRGKSNSYPAVQD